MFDNPPTRPTVKSRLIALTVNGETHEVPVKPRHTLLEIIREVIGLTGTKDGCESGTCGACTVLVDDKPVLSCLTLALDCDGKSVTTIEGLADGDKLTKVQEAFLDQGGVQCGFCTPGMILSASALLKAIATPNDHQIKKALEGNLCRCTGYNSIIAAVRQASGQDVKPVMK